MFLFTVTLVLALASGGWGVEKRSPPYSAASEAQIRFAIENKYDSTGPGAKEPEYAYKTYQTLEEALVAYANDPDTQLPEYEKSIALQKLVEPKPYFSRPAVPRFQPKTVDEYTGYNKLRPNYQDALYTERPRPQYEYLTQNSLGLNQRQPEPFLQKYQQLRSSVVSPLYTRTSPREEFDNNPQYSFSYGVHDKGTGDSKSAHETRDGGSVRGYYTFLDADGKQRTVHYTADDKEGFRATVQRTHTNSQ